ncbi:TPA: hypothetical protein NKV98_003966 [Vibrio parahaemolyticus]|uniref:hypothetical protein n=1 Tax=Vibrio parahaemolyticus TaxID=670 RepID=UPI000932414C|nr:hypothetical protein [Vibrio parahaemolyticus]EJG1286272.1 hypothetical protein [Vibrio parahaemolyticus]EJG1297946.1 hypothetical protein [Vibrio parahaemolyticus]EJG1329847.1 hypothetical protein [Vibrio parahaemolyticus]MCF9342798.1 hypothetical protein [Vibrio parahaemolyticus]MCF9347471.1 hypothetical protein [Vibrio parahaemolyticus]
MNTYEKLTKARNLIDEALTANVGSIGHKSLPAEALAYKQKLLSGLNTDREVFDIVNAINALAMANTDVVHIFTNFSGHVDKFRVYANPANTDYQSNGYRKLLDEEVSIKEENALEQLLFIEGQLTELIIEAREEAEAKAEGEV